MITTVPFGECIALSNILFRLMRPNTGHAALPLCRILPERFILRARRFDPALRLLSRALPSQEGMMAGVSVCRPGACITEIGSAIHDVADRYGYDTVQK